MKKLRTVECGLKLLKMAENNWKRFKKAENGWKWLKTVENNWKRLRKDENAKATIPRETGQRKKTIGKTASDGTDRQTDRQIHDGHRNLQTESIEVMQLEKY